MRQLVPSVVVLFLTMSVSAQIQKSRNNRVYVDDDYEYTEAARRARTINEQIQEGLVFYKARDYKSAAAAFSIAATADPGNFAVQHNLGVSHLYLGDYKTAEQDFRNAIALNQHSANAWHLLGQTYLALNKLDSASDAFTKALAIDADSIDALNGLCIVQAVLKQSEQAVSTCDKARSLKPSISTTYYLAWSFLDLKKYPEAIALLKDCVRLDPNNTTLYIALAEGYYRLKKMNEALSYAQTATQISPDSQAGYASMGYIYFEMKKLKDAKRVFEKALSIDPAFGSVRYNLAMTCLAMKQKDCAREQYAILKTMEPVLSTQLLDIIYSSKVIRLVK